MAADRLPRSPPKRVSNPSASPGALKQKRTPSRPVSSRFAARSKVGAAAKVFPIGGKPRRIVVSRSFKANDPRQTQAGGDLSKRSRRPSWRSSLRDGGCKLGERAAPQLKTTGATTRHSRAVAVIDQRRLRSLSSPTINSAGSRYGAFSHVPFAVMWAATTCSLTGVAISDTASAWLMTNLSADPRAVTMVQAASSLPMFLFTLPAGALADLVEPRRFLIVLEAFISVTISLFGAVVFFDWVTSSNLIATTFLLSTCWSVAAPAWLSITPLLVPPRDLDSANAANSVGYNVSRALGPVLAGFALTGLGPAAPYWIFGAADLASVAALVWWRAPRRPATDLPAERLMSAVQTGLRHAAGNKDLRSTLVRTVAVYPFACAYTALLPLVARDQMTMGPEFYGVLLAVVSVGAVLGSFILVWMRRQFGPDLIVAQGTVGIAAALVLFGISRDPILAVCAAVVAGASWTIVLVGLYVSALISLPDWVRARGLGIFLTVIFGSVTAGSLVWGQIAKTAGLPLALFAAAAAVLLMIPLTWRAKLRSVQGTDLPQ
jgi:predicted MFS family arabinose efflux permease